MSDDTRADVAAAMERMASDESPTTSASAAVGATEGPAVAENSPTVSSAPEDVAAGDRPTAGGRERDEHGRFRPKAAATATDAPKQSKEATATEPPKEAAPAVAPPPTQGEPSVTPAPALKPPQSWRPTAREHFSKLPPEVQAEVVRREQEIATQLQGVSEPKKFHQAFLQTIAPYVPILQAQGVDPLTAVNTFLRTEARLRQGTPVEKAQTMAQLINQYGIPIDALDAALTGQPAPQGQPQGQPQQGEYRDPRVDQLLTQMQAAQQQRTQALQQNIHQELAALAQQAEFFADVREDMADILELAARRGRAMTPQQAYDQAVKLHPELSQVMQQREAAKAAQAQAASVERSRAAASSVRNQPGSNSHTSSGSTRDDVAAAMAALAGR